MFNDPTPSRFPKLEYTPFNAALNAGVGYICGKIADSSPSQWAKICAITTFAHDILFVALSIPIMDLKNKCILYSFLTAITDTASIIALRHFNLIGTTGTLILGSLALWGLIRNLKHS